MIKNQKQLLLFMIVGLAGLLIIRDVVGVNISKYIFLAYVVGCMFMADYETMINMLCFIFPLICGLPSTYIMLCALALLIFKKGKINSWQMCLILLIAAMEFFAAIWYPSMDFVRIIQYISFAAVMIFMLHDDVKLDYLQCIKAFFFGIGLLCVIILISGLASAPDNWLKLFANGQFRFGETHTEEMDGMMISLNANSLAYYSIVGCMCGVVLLEATKNNKLIVFPLLLLTVLAGFLTVSRSWMLIMIICIALYVFSKVNKVKGMLITLFLVGVLLIALTIVLQAYPELADGFLTRFNSDGVEGGNGRVEIFIMYMDIFISNIRFVLLGTGVTDYLAVAGTDISMHNGTQQILVCCGIIGFALYAVVLGGAVWKARKVRKHDKLMVSNWLPIISIIAFTQTIQFLNPTMLMLPFVVGCYALKVENKKEIE